MGYFNVDGNHLAGDRRIKASSTGKRKPVADRRSRLESEPDDRSGEGEKREGRSMNREEEGLDQGFERY
jgi:hypothetical protein